MRDPERIDYYCDELAEVWHKVPDWRFGQFILNMERACRMNEGKDVFYIYTHGAPRGDFLKAIREITAKKKCREIGYEEIKLFPLKSNAATIKIMLKNGGEIIGEFNQEKYIIKVPV